MPRSYTSGSAGTGGATVGAPIVGGGANRVLYEDASQNLATDANLTWDGSGHLLLGAGNYIGFNANGMQFGDVLAQGNAEVQFNGGASRMFIARNSTAGPMLVVDTNVRTQSDSQIGFSSSSTDATTALDTSFNRIRAGQFGLSDGTNTLGVVPGVLFASNTSNTTLANNGNAQSPFAAANDVLTVLATTSYFFEAEYFLTTGATTHTTATLFALAGGASLTSINYWAELWSVTDGTISTTAPSVLRVAAATSTALNATSTATATTIRLSGIMRVNAGGTITPQIQFSADPTGTCLALTNSYFRAYPIGLNTTASVGQWA